MLLNDKKFPPLLPRKLRVMRAKNIKRNTSTPFNGSKGSGVDRTASGRAGKLLGKAKAAQAKHDTPNGQQRPRPEKSTQAPEKFVFEGIRAKRNDGNAGLKFGSKRSKGKPKPRRTQRSTEWRKK